MKRNRVPTHCEFWLEAVAPDPDCNAEVMAEQLRNRVEVVGYRDREPGRLVGGDILLVEWTQRATVVLGPMARGIAHRLPHRVRFEAEIEGVGAGTYTPLIAIKSVVLSDRAIYRIDEDDQSV